MRWGSMLLFISFGERAQAHFGPVGARGVVVGGEAAVTEEQHEGPAEEHSSARE